MNLLNSLKITFRTIKKRPGFTAIIVLTFAIATSASIIIYSYIDALLLTPLPFKEPERLVQIHSIKGGEKGLFSYPEFQDMQKQLVGVEEIAVYRDGGRYNLSGDGKAPEDLTTTFASGNLFRVLGIEPYIGSYWPETLDEKGSHTIMLTYDFWERRFDGKEDIDMLQVTLDGFSYTNYGVLPKGFSFPHRNEAFRAMAFADFVVDARTYRPCIGLARLKPGITIKQFNEELKSFAAFQQRAHPETSLGVTYVAEPLSDLYLGEIQGYLFLLTAAALFLLTIAAINVSNLLLIQSIQKTKETIVRKVLGSSSLGIIFNGVIQSIVFSMLGGLAGLFIAWGIIDVSHNLVSPYLPHWINLTLNKSVLIYAMVTALVLGILTGVLPWIFNKSGRNMITKLKEGQQTTGSKRQNGLQKTLATVQIMVSVILMVGGMLLFKSFLSVSKTDLGFEADEKLTFRIALSWFKYGSPEKKTAFFESSLKRIEDIPGVEKVTLNSILPLTDMVNTSAESQESFIVEGQSEEQQADNPFISVQRVVPNYFEAMNITIHEGNTFDPDEFTSHQYGVLIDQNLAAKMWPSGDAMGKRINIWGNDSDRPYLTVIGVVDNVKHQNVIGENIPNIYISLFAYPHTDAHYVVQSSRSMAELTPLLTQTILSLDENQPTFEYMPMTEVVAKKNWQSKVSSTLFLTIAVLGSMIAGIGLFSMMTFILLLKVKELALRRVLGITDQGVMQLVLKEMLSMSGVGILLGILLSPLLLSPITPFLYEVSIVDIQIYGIVVFALLTASILATFIPFKSALTINPSEVLKGD